MHIFSFSFHSLPHQFEVTKREDVSGERKEGEERLWEERRKMVGYEHEKIVMVMVVLCPSGSCHWK